MKDEHKTSLRQAKIYSIVTLILIVVGSAVSYWIAGRIDFYTKAVMHTSDVLQRTDELYSSVLERETNIRGYVITGEEEFLTYYHQSDVDADLLLTELQELTIDNAQQQNNIEELRGLIDSRVRTFTATIEYIKDHGNLTGFIDSSKVSNALNGFAMIKAVVLRINDVENQLFVKRNQGLINNINALPFIVGLISLFSITIGLVTFFSIYQYNKAQLEANREISLYQQKLRNQILLLDNSNKELEQFAYIASHDLQEPLRKITAFSDLLNEQYADKLEQDGSLYLSRITAAAVRMRRLITDLLEFSRAGKIDAKKVESVKLNDIISELLEDFEVILNEKSADIQVGKLPKITGSETEYRQVFQNLISNALKFSKQGKHPEIKISAEVAKKELIDKFSTLDRNKTYHLIKVSDNGIGFENHYAEKIFSIFQRLHGKTEYEGTGIGLSISKKIIEKNGGVIFAESTKGTGSIFYIILPSDHT